MDWADVGKAIIKIGAPILGTALGGPAGGALGSVIASQFGSDDNPDDVMAKMIADPEATVKLLEIQSNERIEIEKVNTANLEIALKDKESAREMHKEKVRAGKIDYNLIMLTFLVVVGFFGSIALVSFVNIPQAAADILFLLVGSLSTNFNQIISYFFGSSAGSKSKDSLLKIK